MNKTAIKNFAIWARRKLIADITYKAGLIGVTDKGVAAPLPQSKPDLQFFDIGTKEYANVSGKEVTQRAALVSAIKVKEKTTDYKTAFQNVIEEVAYTWFNRLIAVRFMEVNDYLPSRVRVLSSENPAKNEPDFVTTPFETDLDFTPYERNRVMQLKDENKLDELFRLLFIKQCNKLHEILPELFEATNDYTELLLAISFTDKDDVVYHLVHDIQEDDFNVAKEGQVEIIGWMYQYYNTEPKDEVFALLKKNVKITKERIPAATQLFTPDWIVRYMVENSLGRLWVEGHPNDALKSGWKYYLEEAEQEPEVQAQLEKIRAEYKTINPEDIKLIDPCMGSGHILVYAFDVLMQIYVSCGYTERDAAAKILENNLYGLDIDQRAYQLAYFAVMMKARQYDRRFFTRDVKPNLYAPGNYAEGQEFGSLLTVDELEPKPEPPKELTLFNMNYEDKLNTWNFRRLLAQKYDVVVTNPPYMGSSGMSGRLAQYVKDYYPDSKSDLFAVFIERCGQMTKRNGYQAMITQHAWMFLSSFEKLRAKLLSVDTVNMAHLGARAFEEIGGEVVQTTSFVMRKSHTPGYKGVYCRLIEPTTQKGKEDMFLAGENRFYVNQEIFSFIPGRLRSYWLSSTLLSIYSNAKPLSEYGVTRKGLSTSDNNRFIRLWHEVNFGKVKFGCKAPSDTFDEQHKWYPYIHGGVFRKWYPPFDSVVNFENDAKEMKETVMRKYPYLKNPDFVVKKTDIYFVPGILWNDLADVFNAKFMEAGFIYSDVTPSYIPNNQLESVLAYFNSKPFSAISSVISQGMHFSTGHIPNIPYIPVCDEKAELISPIVRQNIEIVKSDETTFESSWDFKKHPFAEYKHCLSKVNTTDSWYIKISYEAWEYQCQLRFNTLKANEEELNRIFIDIYGLQDELTPDVEDKDVTVRKADLGRDIRSLISYAVGCMFGRYSLDVDGLAYAGGEWDSSKYKTYLPDADNCIPITDEEYFKDDIVGRFVEFIRAVYGAETLEENLDYIAKALAGKGNTSREVIRNYFLNDFFKNHCQIYQKRPIYWLFDSGKQNGFKALCYMHRWNADTVGNVRVEYLHRVQRVYEKEIERMQETIDNSRNAREVAAAEKRKEKLTKQLKEAKDYDTKIAHIALSRIDIDLDDGVKVNYEKVQTAQDGKKIEILAKI
jgi:hypothetical protein